MAVGGVDCWLYRLNKIKTSLKMTNLQPYKTSNENKQNVRQCLCIKFEMFWKYERNKTKTSTDGHGHSKLRYYKTLKNSFTSEPYIYLIRNCNQHCWITRLRIRACP